MHVHMHFCLHIHKCTCIYDLLNILNPDIDPQSSPFELPGWVGATPLMTANYSGSSERYSFLDGNRCPANMGMAPEGGHIDGRGRLAAQRCSTPTRGWRRRAAPRRPPRSGEPRRWRRRRRRGPPPRCGGAASAATPRRGAGDGGDRRGLGGAWSPPPWLRGEADPTPAHQTSVRLVPGHVA